MFGGGEKVKWIRGIVRVKNGSYSLFMMDIEWVMYLRLNNIVVREKG